MVSPKAIFAVLYSPNCTGACDAAVLLNSPPFYVSHDVSSLQELAKWVYGMITEPPVAIELNTTHAIRLLREAVSAVNGSLLKIEPKDVEDIFGGRVFFETILGVKEESEIPIGHLRAAASYLLVNQILFYQILAKERNKLTVYPELDSKDIEDPHQLRSYFERVLAEDYTPIFGFDVVSKIKGSKALEAIKVTVDAINALSPESLGHDVLGKIFHNLIPFDLRKVIAAFYTNIQAGEILATLSIETPNALVIDPACGSGTLLVSAYQRKKDLLETSGHKFTFNTHKRFVEEELTGVDIMPFAAHLAAVHLSLQAPLYTTDFVRIAIQDSTSLKPDMTILPAQEQLSGVFKQRKITEDFSKPIGKPKGIIPIGPVKLSEKGRSRPIKLNKVDLVIMTPPFTRFQRIPPAYKTKLSERFPEKRYHNCVHGQLGLHGYFLLLADRFLKENGRLAAVLPITTLSAKGLYAIQDLWFKDYSIEHLVVCEGRSAFSENVLTREILLVARKSKPKDNMVAVSILKVSPDAISISEARSISETLKELRENKQVGTVDSEKYLFRLLPQKELAKSKHSLFRTLSMYRKDIIDLAETIESLFDKSGKKMTFGEYLEAVKGEIHESPRGIERFGYYGLSVISDESRALKKHDFWYVEDKTKRKLRVKNRFSHLVFDIPLSCLSPNIRRYAGLTKFNITDETDYVVVETFDKLTEFLKASEIETTERKEALRQVKSGEWRKFVKNHSSKLAIFYKIDITAVGTHNLTFYSDDEMFIGGSFWNLVIKEEVQNKLFCLWFNSTINLFQVLTERKEQRGGWIWLDDYVMREFTMPNLTKLSDEEVDMLLAVFQKYGKTPLPNLLEQLEKRDFVRREIDRAFLRLLGMPEKEISVFLERLYDILAREIGMLKTVMAEGKGLEKG
jgi:hypothetical protein